MAALQSLCLFGNLREVRMGIFLPFFLQVTWRLCPLPDQHWGGEHSLGPWVQLCILTTFASDQELHGSPEARVG